MSATSIRPISSSDITTTSHASSAGDCLVTVSADGLLVTLNRDAERLFCDRQTTALQLLGQSLLKVLGFERDLANTLSFQDLLSRYNRDGSLTLRGKTALGKPLTLHWVAAAEVDGNFVLLFKDARVSQPIRDEVVSLREQLQATHLLMTDCVIVTDAMGLIVSVNPSARSMLKLGGQAGVGAAFDSIFNVFAADSHKPLPNIVIDALNRGRPSRTPAGASLFISGEEPASIVAIATPIRNSRRQVSGCVMVFRDVRDNQRTAAKLDWQASHDTLTQLPNRVQFEVELTREVESALRGGTQHGLIVIDLHKFSVVNDTCGHAAGDQLLVQLAELFGASLRSQDMLSRLGSDDFGILLRGATLAGTQRVASAIIQAVQAFTFKWGEHRIKPAVCLGAVAIDSECESTEQALTAATAACQEAKEAGRNRIHLHHNLNSATVKRRRSEMNWVARITSALVEDRLELFAQPVVATQASSSQAHHFEVLVRLRNESGDIVAPNHFLPAAERFGLMEDIDRQVLQKVVSWIESRPQGRESYAVNVSGSTLSNETFTGFVLKQIQSSGIDASRLHFEITETAAVANFQSALAFIHRLKALGCQFYLDDFGSGLSSFAYLKDLPVDYLKIDGSFVRAMQRGSIDFAMVSSINHMAGVIGLKTVAEYVENAEILALLQEIGVDFAQGYFFAKPQPIATAVRLLE